jgi:hypothetical protein
MVHRAELKTDPAGLPVTGSDYKNNWVRNTYRTQDFKLTIKRRQFGPGHKGVLSKHGIRQVVRSEWAKEWVSSRRACRWTALLTCATLAQLLPAATCYAAEGQSLGHQCLMHQHTSAANCARMNHTGPGLRTCKGDDQSLGVKQ